MMDSSLDSTCSSVVFDVSHQPRVIPSTLRQSARRKSKIKDKFLAQRNSTTSLTQRQSTSGLTQQRHSTSSLAQKNSSSALTQRHSTSALAQKHSTLTQRHSTSSLTQKKSISAPFQRPSPNWSPRSSWRQKSPRQEGRTDGRTDARTQRGQTDHSSKTTSSLSSFKRPVGPISKRSFGSVLKEVNATRENIIIGGERGIGLKIADWEDVLSEKEPSRLMQSKPPKNQSKQQQQQHSDPILASDVQQQQQQQQLNTNPIQASDFQQQQQQPDFDPLQPSDSQNQQESWRKYSSDDAEDYESCCSLSSTSAESGMASASSTLSKDRSKGKDNFKDKDKFKDKSNLLRVTGNDQIDAEEIAAERDLKENLSNQLSASLSLREQDFAGIESSTTTLRCTCGGGGAVEIANEDSPLHGDQPRDQLQDAAAKRQLQDAAKYQLQQPKKEKKIAANPRRVPCLGVSSLQLARRRAMSAFSLDTIIPESSTEIPESIGAERSFSHSVYSLQSVDASHGIRNGDASDGPAEGSIFSPRSNGTSIAPCGPSTASNGPLTASKGSSSASSGPSASSSGPSTASNAPTGTPDKKSKLPFWNRKKSTFSKADQRRNEASSSEVFVERLEGSPADSEKNYNDNNDRSGAISPTRQFFESLSPLFRAVSSPSIFEDLRVKDEKKEKGREEGADNDNSNDNNNDNVERKNNEQANNERKNRRLSRFLEIPIPDRFASSKLGNNFSNDNRNNNNNYSINNNNKDRRRSKKDDRIPGASSTWSLSSDVVGAMTSTSSSNNPQMTTPPRRLFASSFDVRIGTGHDDVEEINFHPDFDGRESFGGGVMKRRGSRKYSMTPLSVGGGGEGGGGAGGNGGAVAENGVANNNDAVAKPSTPLSNLRRRLSVVPRSLKEGFVIPQSPSAFFKGRGGGGNGGETGKKEKSSKKNNNNSIIVNTTSNSSITNNNAANTAKNDGNLCDVKDARRASRGVAGRSQSVCGGRDLKSSVVDKGTTASDVDKIIIPNRDRDETIEVINQKNNPRLGCVLHLTADGLRVLKLERPVDGKPFGFRLAKRRGGGEGAEEMIVSRLCFDVRSPEWFAGLLAVGDEIKAVDDRIVKSDWSLEDAAAALSLKDSFTMKVLPVEKKWEEEENLLV